MIEQPARVVETRDGRAHVEVLRASACSGCTGTSGCSTSVLGDWLLRRRRRFVVDNPIGAQVGDNVILEIDERVLQSLAVFAFLLPLAGLLGFAMMGSWAGQLVDARFAEPVAIVAGLTGLGVGIVLVRKLVDQRYRHEQQIPKLISATHQPVVMTRLGTARN